jgi:plasmid stabilization system protein ParE
MRVELRTEAVSDLIEAAWFYERQRGDLGDEFIDAIFAHLAHLETFAGGHEVVFGLHRMLAKKFPYGLYYKVDAEVVDVVAILDCRRNPSRVFRTLGDRTDRDLRSGPAEGIVDDTT